MTSTDPAVRRLMLLDTAALYFRAFHGVPDTVTAPDGTPVNAARGLLDIVARLVAEFAPTDLVACWDDAWRPGWRVDLVPEYKAHRLADAARGIEEVPERLVPQVPVIRAALDALGIAVVGAADHEADDVIGTLAARADGPVDVVTSDRDLFQVIDDARGVRVVSTARGMRRLELVTDAVVVERYGVHAAQYADFATLRGDPSDGLPGVAGIGDRTAASLITRYGDLDGVLAATDVGGAVGAKLAAGEEYVRRAVRVVRVVPDLPLPDVDARIEVTDDRRAAAEALAERHGLGGSMRRAITALARDRGEERTA